MRFVRYRDVTGMRTQCPRTSACKWALTSMPNKTTESILRRLLSRSLTHGIMEKVNF